MNLNLGVKGEYEISVLRGNGAAETYTFSNLILDSFIDRWSNTSGVTASSELSCYVGSGTTAPAVTDTQLEAFVAKSPADANISGNYLNYKTGSDYWTEYTATFTYSLGQVVGNISEVGIQINDGSKVHTNIDSRSLIKDATNSPITLSLTSSDQLIVRYKITFKIPTTQSSAVVSIAGNSTTVTWECHNALDYRAWSIYNMMQFYSAKASYIYMKNAALVNNPELEVPQGGGVFIVSVTTTGVKISPGVREYTFTLPSSSVPVGGSFNYLLFYPAIQFGGAGSKTQSGFHFSVPVEKTSDQIFRVTYGVSLTRL